MMVHRKNITTVSELDAKGTDDPNPAGSVDVMTEATRFSWGLLTMTM